MEELMRFGSIGVRTAHQRVSIAVDEYPLVSDQTPMALVNPLTPLRLEDICY